MEIPNSSENLAQKCQAALDFVETKIPPNPVAELETELGETFSVPYQRLLDGTLTAHPGISHWSTSNRTGRAKPASRR